MASCFLYKRREFIALIGGAATAWPLGARAQQSAKVPTIGFVYTSQTSSEASPFVSAFQQGLRETGFIEGQNVAVEYRWPGGQYDRLPALASAPSGGRGRWEHPTGDGGKNGNLCHSNCLLHGR